MVTGIRRTLHDLTDLHFGNILFRLPAGIDALSRLNSSMKNMEHLLLSRLLALTAVPSLLAYPPVVLCLFGLVQRVRMLILLNLALF